MYTTIRPLLTPLSWARKVLKSLPYLNAKQTFNSLLFDTTRFPLSDIHSFFSFSQTSLTSQTWAGTLHKSRVFIPRDYNRRGFPGGHFSRYWNFPCPQPLHRTCCHHNNNLPLYCPIQWHILVLFCPNHSAVSVHLCVSLTRISLVFSPLSLVLLLLGLFPGLHFWTHPLHSSFSWGLYFSLSPVLTLKIFMSPFNSHIIS